MAITAQMVKELREATGAGMADCKKALEESNGNFEEAVEYLRKKGAASAAKRADKEANEGLVISKSTDDHKKAILVEITCETDFVAKNSDFISYAETVGDVLLNNDIDNVDDLMKFNTGSATVEDLHNGILAKFSEKITINRISSMKSDGYIESYIHGGSKLGVLVDYSGAISTVDQKQVAKDIAMQIAAMRPGYVTRDEVTTEILDKEKEIFIQQAIEEGKPADIAEKVATGKIQKYYKENCLVEQVFVKDSKKSVNDILKDLSTSVGSEVKVNRFVRLAIGE